MTTVIDSLLVVLGLDSSGFDKGRKQTAEGFKKTRDEAEKTGGSLGEFDKKAAAGFASLKNEAIGLFLAFQGASSIKDFVGNMITGDAAAGRLAKNLGMSVNELTAYGLAIQSVGGDAGEANNAFQLLAAAREQWKLTGTTGHDRERMLMGFGPHDLDNTATAFAKLAEAAQRMPRTQFYNLAHQLGLSDGVINLLELGPEKMRELVKARQEDAAATEENARASAALEAKWADLVAKITALLRPEIYRLVDATLDIVDAFTKGKDAGDGFNAALVGVAVVAAVIDAPFVALAAAIALCIGNLDTLKKDYAHAIWYTHGWGLPGGFGAYEAMKKAGVQNTDDIDRIIDEENARNNAKGSPGDASTPAAGDTGGGGGRGGAGGGASGGLLHDVPSAKGVIRTELMHAGMTAEQAAGIVAGIEAEGGGLGQSANGAFGIGQWRGKRKDALLAKYGKAPSLSQQVDFLVRELRGGDPGGRAVTGQQSAAATMVAYLSKFMRPQGADNEHYKDLIADIQRGYRALGQAAPAGIGGRSSTVSIGSIHLPGVKDADGFARQLPDAIRRRSMTTQADRGLD